MKGIIIAGGLGTRLRPLTYMRPKPLVPVANRPFLEYQVALLKEHGIDDIVFATNYMAEMIEAHFGDGSRFGVRMRYAVETTPLGTGGAIRNAADLFPGQTVVVFNGDILTDFDLSAIVRFHEERRAIATVTLAPIPRPHPFGALLLDSEGLVQSWHEPSEAEKQAMSKAGQASGSDLINAGFYVLSNAAVERIPQGARSSIERDIFPPLIASGGVFGFAPGGFWMDLGRPAQLLEATKAVLCGLVRTSVASTAIGSDTQVAPSARIDGSSAVGSRCIVGEGARIEGSIVLDGVTVGRNALLRGVIVDENAVIENDVVAISDNEVLVIAAETVLK